MSELNQIQQYIAEIAELKKRLAEAEQTLSAIQNGEVDAVLVYGKNGDQVYSLTTAEHPYRMMIEQMIEGALTLSNEGIILYCNQSFAQMIKANREEIISTSILDYIASDSRNQFERLIQYNGRAEISLLAKDKSLVPTLFALSTYTEEQRTHHSTVIADLTEHMSMEQILVSTRFTQTLFEQISDIVLICNTSGIVMRASERAFNLFGGNLIGQSLDQVFEGMYLAPNEAQSPSLESPVRFTELRDRQIASGKETVLINDKSRRTLLLNYSQIIEGNNILGYSITFSDITERKQAEEALKRYNAELEAANKELEAFSYSVSHDLRQPLRALDGFSLAIERNLGDKLDPTNKDYLNRVRKASQTMSRLIDDLLQLSRITRAGIVHTEVNLSNMAATILEDLRKTQPERQAELKIASNIIVRGDKALLNIALKNILENAWKFSSKCPQTRIEMGILQQNGDKVYFVKDNGVGFDMQYKDKLFQPFQRLHSDEDYPGTGIGLATVQRIIRRHGGSIWAESAVGQGATIYFTLGTG